MCAIPQLVSAPLNPIRAAEHFRRSHPQCEHSYGQHMCCVSEANEEKVIQSIRNHKESFISQGSIVGNTRILKYGKLFLHRRPNFITLYFHEPDYTAHRHGPDADQVE